MSKIIRRNKPLQKEDDCNCGKRVNKITRKKIVYKKSIKKK